MGVVVMLLARPQDPPQLVVSLDRGANINPRYYNPYYEDLH